MQIQDLQTRIAELETENASLREQLEAKHQELMKHQHAATFGDTGVRQQLGQARIDANENT